MCLGFMPSSAIRDEYHLTELYELGVAAIRGDVLSFETILLHNQKSFIRLGIYLVLVHVKTIAYRNLFKRIMGIVNSLSSSTSTGRLNLTICEGIMNKLLGMDVDLDEIECIISNHIFSGRIKGYLSHQKRYLIVSKTDPFPISAVIKR